MLNGYLITIIDYGSELAILAIGMTLVTAASGGQDISVGAAIAISGSVLLRVLCGTRYPSETCSGSHHRGFPYQRHSGNAVRCLQRYFGGLLQDTANGRDAHSLHGRTLYSRMDKQQRAPHRQGSILLLLRKLYPRYPDTYAVLHRDRYAFIATWALLKFTTLGLYVQSVGINEKTARLNGLNPELIKLGTYVILGACVAVAALIKVSRLSTINYSVIAKDIEMDAILAVALGGNALSGGKFSMGSSILGAYVIQFLTTTLYKFGVSADALPAYKAVVVILLVVLSAPAVREKTEMLFKKLRAPNGAAKRS